MFDLSGLNPAQRQAAETLDGPVLILAGAGSGKTRTITFRMANMMLNHRIPGERILAVSFTNKAAQEMKGRIKALIRPRRQKLPYTATFHKLGLDILREHLHLLGYPKRFTIYDTSDQLSVIREALKNYTDPEQKAFDRKTIQQNISRLKNFGITVGEYPQSEHFDDSPYAHATHHCYLFYQERLKFNAAIDFDDILLLSNQIFKDYPDIATAYSERYRYIMVDEYQDTNSLQFALIEALTKTHNNLCVVGDDDQSIYAFRGADITNILQFEKNFKNTKVVKLEQNYRSNNEILELSNAVIKENKRRKLKSLWSERESGERPLLWICQDSEHEAQVVSSDIGLQHAQGRPLNEVAVLFRSMTQIAALEDELRLAQIPYTVVGGQKFYEKKEIKDLTAYMATLLNPRDEVALRRILNVPNRGIGAKTLETMVAQARSQNRPLFDILKESPKTMPFSEMMEDMRGVFNQKSLPESILHLIERTGYEDYLSKVYDGAKQIERRLKDIHSLVESSRRFIESFEGTPNLRSFVERLLLADSQTRRDPVRNEEGVVNEVSLMTIHSSKGLEFDRVYVLGMEEELLPHKKVITQGESIEEERRLAYVALTRARHKLIMTHTKERVIYNKRRPGHPSRFIKGKDHLYRTQDRTRFEHLSAEEEKDFKRNFFEDLMQSLSTD